MASNMPPIVGPAIQLSSSKRKAQRREYASRLRSPFPRSPKHGKHSFVQGDPNTKDHQR